MKRLHISPVVAGQIADAIRRGVARAKAGKADLTPVVLVDSCVDDGTAETGPIPTLVQLAYCEPCFDASGLPAEDALREELPRTAPPSAWNAAPVYCDRCRKLLGVLFDGPDSHH